MRQTSIQAYKQIEANGLLSRVRWMVYSHLFHHGPLTGGELNRQMGGGGYHKRLSELESLGVIVGTGIRVCSVTGMKCEQWDVTCALPSGTIKQSGTKPTRAEFGKAFAQLRVIHRHQQMVGKPFPPELVEVLSWVRDRYT